MGYPYFGTDQSYMPVDTVDETSAHTDMMGSSSVINQVNGQPGWKNSPTRSLVVMWFVVLGVYWFVGWFFRGQRK
jgi:hypothetical protein